MTGSERPMLHCILRDPPDGVVLPAGLRDIGADGLHAVVANVDPHQVRAADSTRLQAYADLIACIHRDSPLIPMRFGCVFSDDAAVLELLTKHHDRLLSMLDQLDNCVEIGVRLLLPPVPADGAAEALQDGVGHAERRPGHGHLAVIRQRLAEETRAAARAGEARGTIERITAGLYRDVRQEFGQVGGRSLLSLYFLVPREHGEAFVGALREDPAAVPGAGLITGPWPPYNFVGAIDDDLRPLA